MTDAFTAEAGDRTDSGQGDGVGFPVEWRLRSNSSASPVGIRFETTEGGQAVRVLGMPYWVGRCRVSGTVGSEEVQGSGYVLIRGVEEPLPQ